MHGEATPSRLTALAVLEAAGPLRISDLAARIAIGLPAMSRIVERLSQYGWAARHPDPTDHRARLVSITEAGVARTVKSSTRFLAWSSIKGLVESSQWAQCLDVSDQNAPLLPACAMG